MDYDPIKDRLGVFFSRNPFLQRIFFTLLNLFFLRSWHVRQVLRRIGNRLADKTTISILDAGTGFGQYVWFLLKTFRNTTVTAVDVKQDYLENAKKFYSQTRFASRVSWEIADLTTYRTKNPVDLILSVDVMEHIEDDRAVFDRFYENLAEGGLVLINTPSDLGGSGISEGQEESFIGEHVRDGYSLEQLSEKLADSHLDVVEHRYTYGRFGTIAWRMLIKWPMQMIGISRFFLAVLPFYYLPVFPVGMLLNYLDVQTNNPEGTGLLVVAMKKTQGFQDGE